MAAPTDLPSACQGFGEWGPRALLGRGEAAQAGRDRAVYQKLAALLVDRLGGDADLGGSHTSIIT
jgi:hypothetical protein